MSSPHEQFRLQVEEEFSRAGVTFSDWEASASKLSTESQHALCRTVTRLALALFRKEEDAKEASQLRQMQHRGHHFDPSLASAAEATSVPPPPIRQLLSPAEALEAHFSAQADAEHPNRTALPVPLELDGDGTAPGKKSESPTSCHMGAPNLRESDDDSIWTPIDRALPCQQQTHNDDDIPTNNTTTASYGGTRSTTAAAAAATNNHQALCSVDPPNRPQRIDLASLLQKVEGGGGGVASSFSPCSASLHSPRSASPRPPRSGAHSPRPGPGSGCHSPLRPFSPSSSMGHGGGFQPFSLTRESSQALIPDTRRWLLNDRFEFIRKLGGGSQGTVWKCLDHRSKNHVAIKIVVRSRLKKRFTMPSRGPLGGNPILSTDTAATATTEGSGLTPRGGGAGGGGALSPPMVLSVDSGSGGGGGGIADAMTIAGEAAGDDYDAPSTTTASVFANRGGRGAGGSRWLALKASCEDASASMIAVVDEESRRPLSTAEASKNPTVNIAHQNNTIDEMVEALNRRGSAEDAEVTSDASPTLVLGAAATTILSAARDNHDPTQASFQLEATTTSDRARAPSGEEGDAAEQSGDINDDVGTALLRDNASILRMQMMMMAGSNDEPGDLGTFEIDNDATLTPNQARLLLTGGDSLSKKGAAHQQQGPPPADMPTNLAMEIFCGISSHPNILPLQEVINDDSCRHIFLVMPLAQKFPCRLLPSGASNRTIPIETAVRYIGEAASALALLHAAGIVHCDVKLDNFLLLDGKLMLADFGLCQIANDIDVLGGGDGTVGYWAPECHYGASAAPASAYSHLNAESDCYALGLCLFVMILGRFPYWPSNTENIFSWREAVSKAHHQKPSLADRIHTQLSSEKSAVTTTAKELLLGLLDENPNNRLTANAVSRLAFQ